MGFSPSSYRAVTEHRPERASDWLWLVRDVPGGPTEVAQPIQFETAHRHAHEPTPTLELDSGEFRDFMQAMVDAAWNMGIRPSGVNDLDNTLAATRYHLEDMRALSGVTKKLKED